MKNSVKLLLSSFLVVLFVFSFRSIASAASVSKIIFSQNGGVMRMINPDGSDLTDLGPGYDPQISPDGTKILYAAVNVTETCPRRKLDIFVRNIDGTNVQDLTVNQDQVNCIGRERGSWSSDGTKILFEANDQLYTMNADGTNVIDLGIHGWYSSWSPDGTKIAFISTNASGQGTIHTAYSDGSNVVDLGLQYVYSVPAWSPDSSKIAYYKYDYSTNPVKPSINVVNADGTNDTVLVNGPGAMYSLGWSPDGSTIAFQGSKDINGTITNDTNGLFLIDVATGTLSRIYYSGNPDDPYNSYTSWGTMQITPKPIIAPISDTTLNEGDSYTFSGSFTDSSSSSWTATVDYGDGSGIQPLPLSGMNFSLNHTYQDNGSYPITVTVSNNEGGMGTASATVTVENIAPQVQTITAPSQGIKVNTSVSVSAAFQDAGVLDTHTAVWDWGDNTTSSGNVTESSGSGTVSGQHVYTQAGFYTLTLTVTDKDGGVDTKQYQYIPVYNTAAGGLTGAGRYTSPAGAYIPNPSTSGQVIFTANAHYVGNTLTGSSNLIFTAAHMIFTSSSNQWLVVTKPTATLQQTGKINGTGNYTLLISALDGNLPGAGGTDKIRVRIINNASGSTLYDTQLNDPLTATPLLPVSGIITIQ